MDTSCVETSFSAGTMIAFDCRAIETALDANTLQRSELDCLICNKLLEYTQTAFIDKIEEYVKESIVVNVKPNSV